jgi:hypothetical protein
VPDPEELAAVDNEALLSLPHDDVAVTTSGKAAATMQALQVLPLADEKIYLHCYSSQGMEPETFQNKLLQSKELQKCCEAMERAGRNWLLPSQAKMFVKAEQCEAVEVALKLKRIVLKPFHVILSESFEQALKDSLQATPSKNRPRTKSKGKQVLVDKGWQSVFIVKSTFLCEAPALRPSHAVVQSTTEATTECLNCRRVL